MDWAAILKAIGEKAAGEAMKFVLAELEKLIKGKNPTTDKFFELAAPLLEEAATHQGRLSEDRRLDFQEKLDWIAQLLGEGV